MVVEFLEKYKGELIIEREGLENDLQLVEAKLREDSKLIDMLKQEEEYFFQEFSPREMNSKNEARIKELQEKSAEFEKKKAQIEDDLETVAARMKEVDYVMLYVQKEKVQAAEREDSVAVQVVESVAPQVVEDLADVQAASEVISSDAGEEVVIATVSTDTLYIKNDLENILTYIDFDPGRAKVEINSIIKKL